jgi:16S rRNA (cytosine1402-N4)-methyltransferase
MFRFAQHDSSAARVPTFVVLRAAARTLPFPTIMPDDSPPHRPPRRVRYRGKNPRRFDQKYKEHAPDRYSDTIAKVLASGKTPAGSHRPIMVNEVLAVLEPQPGEIGVDATLGYGGHAREILPLLQPSGRLLGLDADPIELPKTEARLRGLGFEEKTFSAHRTNFAGLAQLLARLEIPGVDFVLADLGVSSMQLDDPRRGFSLKLDGPLDLRMNPERGSPAFILLQKLSAEKLARLLRENADESNPALGPALAGKTFSTTLELARAVSAALPSHKEDERERSVRRVFQALRIAVNDEFSALETFLRNLPACLNLGGRIAILTFHSGEDRRVKKSFEAGLREGHYAAVATEVVRPTAEERSSNPRASSAKLRWARRRL